MSLNWFSSYLSNQKFFSSANGKTSTCAPLTCSPQGSILGPILFLLYMLPLGHIIHQYGCVLYDWYTDDTQIYLFDFSNLTTLYKCMTEIENWMSFFQLNHSKTEGLVMSPQRSSKNLGIIFDSQLKFDKHIRAVTQSCFFHLRNIAKISPMLSQHLLKKVQHLCV